MVSPGLCASHAAREALTHAMPAAARWGDGSVLFGLDRRCGRAVRSTDSRERGGGQPLPLVIENASWRCCYAGQRLFLRLGEAERKPVIGLPSGGGGAERVEPCVPTGGVEA